MASPKQIAARKKFAAMVKSKRSIGSKKKNKMVDNTPDKTESKKRKAYERKAGMKT